MRCSRTPVITLLAAAVLAPAAPAAAQQPVAPSTVFTDGRIDAPTSAALPDGRVALAWTNTLGSGDTTLGVVRPAGQLAPTTPQVLGTGAAAEDLRLLPGGPPSSPLLTVLHAGAEQTVQTLRLDRDAFSTPVSPLGVDAKGRYPSAARCPNGTTAFAYQRTVSLAPATYAVHSWRGDDVGRRGAAGVTGDDSSDFDQAPIVTCDRNEQPLLAYADDPDAASPVAGDRLIVRPLDGGPLLLDRTTAGGGYASTPDARFAPDGRLWILWTEAIGGSSTIYVATRAPGDDGPVSISTLATNKEASALFFDPSGNTHVVLVDPFDVEWTVRTSAPGTGTFGGAVQLPAAGGASGRVITGHPDGRPRLLSIANEGPNRAYRLLGIPPAGSGSGSSPVILRASGGATFSYLPSGDLFAAAADDHGGGQRLLEGGLDSGAPPRLDDLDVPALAAPGVPTRLRVRASDPLGLSAFSWKVDGHTLTEQDTAHIFTEPGTYAVEVRAVDRAGNLSELTRTVRVLNPDAVTIPHVIAPTPSTVRDTTAPKLRSGVATRGRKGKAKQKVTVKFSADETVAADVELIGTFKRGKAKGTLILKATRVATLNPNTARTLALGIPKGLDKSVVKRKLLVRLTLTDLFGNRTQKSVAVKLAK